jgi:hypothetical protein
LDTETVADSLAELGGAARSARIEQIRGELLPGGAFEFEIAEALNCSTRHVKRLNLPFRKFGSRRIYDVPGSREVIRNHVQASPPR